MIDKTLLCGRLAFACLAIASSGVPRRDHRLHIADELPRRGLRARRRHFRRLLDDDRDPQPDHSRRRAVHLQREQRHRLLRRRQRGRSGVVDQLRPRRDHLLQPQRRRERHRRDLLRVRPAGRLRRIGGGADGNRYARRDLDPDLRRDGDQLHGLRLDRRDRHPGLQHLDARQLRLRRGRRPHHRGGAGDARFRSPRPGPCCSAGSRRWARARADGEPIADRAHSVRSSIPRPTAAAPSRRPSARPATCPRSSGTTGSR